jgi:probable HAF family extracellular repeat protein
MSATRPSVTKRITMLIFSVLLCLSTIAEAQVLTPIFLPLRLVRVTTYTLVDLGANTGNNVWSFAYGINNSGQAVGEIDYWQGGIQVQHAFRTMGNQPIALWTSDDLGTLAFDKGSAAFAISNNGTAAGDSAPSYVHWDDFYNYGAKPIRGFRSQYAGAALEDMKTPYYADRYFIRGIDAYGRTVGMYTNTGTNAPHAFFSNCGPGCTTQLDPFLGNPSMSEAYGVNTKTQIVGWRNGSAGQRAFSMKVTGYTFNGAPIFGATDIVLPGGIWSKALAVNENGQVVGESGTASGSQHAFFWNDNNGNGIAEWSEIFDLDSGNGPMSSAKSINAGGFAVGYSGIDDKVGGGSHAVIYLPNLRMLDLNTLVPAGTGRWTLRTATGINDNGQIVGYMEDHDDTNITLRAKHAYRLDPSGYIYVAF